MLDGTVKWFDKKKGYGFIESVDGPSDIFVHYTCFADTGIRSLQEGDAVCFEIVEGEKGPRATNLSLKAAMSE